MRLEPIENPSNPFLKIAYWFSRRQFGKVMMPLKVIYARKFSLLRFAMKIGSFEERGTTLAPELRILIKLAAATENGCGFCQDIALAQGVQKRIGSAKFTAILNGDRNEAFDEKERAVLKVIRQYSLEKKVSNENFDNLRHHFTDTEIVEILALNAFEQFYNALTIPLEIESDGLKTLAEQTY